MIYLHLAFRSWYHTAKTPRLRIVGNAGFVLLTCDVCRFAFTALLPTPPGGALWSAPYVAPVLLATVPIYFGAGACFVVPALWRRGATVRSVLGTLNDNVLEATTVCFGAVTAVLVATVPALTAFVIPGVLLLERGALARELELVASTDAKTDVLNTSGWRHEARPLVEQAARGRESVGCLMIDLDHFKRINDRHGHLAGDVVLRCVAQAISAQVRSSDLVGRFGGEEFVVLTPRASPDEVAAIAERIRSAVARLVIEIATGEAITGVSVSVGVAVTSTARTIDELLHRADEAMYRAKEKGRNQVTVADAA